MSYLTPSSITKGLLYSSHIAHSWHNDHFTAMTILFQNSDPGFSYKQHVENRVSNQCDIYNEEPLPLWNQISILE